MKRILHRFSAVAAVVLVAGCAHRYDLTRPEAQDNFGVRMAKMNLWREAMFRFRRAVQIEPSNAMAHNNLAVAYEANGDFDSARKEYLEALKLDRSNPYIQKNYSRYVEFLSRNKKRAAPKTAAAAPADSVPAAMPRPVDVPPQPVPPPPPPGGSL
ncbi:MAG: tetratricopeptide repeat protein [Acidobacteriota bacterium]